MMTPTRTVMRFRVLDVDLELAGPPEVVAPIGAAYARFAIPGAASALPASSSLETPLIDGRAVSLLPGVDPTLLVYQQFLVELQRRLGAMALLHGAGLVGLDGAALLIAAPAGHGKTSLTLELLARGYRFLTDDYCPFDFASGEVHPYPRAVAIAADGAAPIPETFRRAATDPAAVRLLSKTVIDVGQALGEQAVAATPAPLKHVFLLTAADPAQPPAPTHTQLAIAALSSGRARLERLITEVDGVRVVDRGAKAEWCGWRLELDHDRRPTKPLLRVLEDEAVVFVERIGGATPDFVEPPTAVRVRRREAALCLGQEMLNRRGGGKFLAERRWGPPQLLLELAAALTGAACWRMRPGPLALTADLIQRLTD